jgi:lysophospholipase L1-like esterase
MNPDAEAGTESALFRVAFMGDSFVEALQVPWSASFVGILESSACGNAEMRNYGVSSYSPILYPIQWQRFIRDFDPDVVFVMLYGNDVRDDEDYLQLAQYDDEGNVVAVPGPELSWFRLQLRRSYFLRFLRKQQLRIAWLLKHRGTAGDRVAGRYLEENREITPQTSINLLRLVEQVRRNDTALVMTAVPSKVQGEGSVEFADEVRTWAGYQGVAYLDLASAFADSGLERTSLFFENDIHFNDRGHRLVANAIRSTYPDFFNCPGRAAEPSK